MHVPLFYTKVQQTLPRTFNLNGVKNSLFGQVKSVLALDLRSLALMRIGVAFVIMMDLVIRSTSLEAHYSDTGVLPLEALFRYAWNANYFSLYTAVSSWYMMALIFIINFACAFCLLLGYRTRLFTFVCWIFMISLHNRNPLIEQGGDDLLRLLLFWGMFLPWGYYYSLDSQRIQKNLLPSNQYISLAGFAYICQLFYLYFFSALLKSSPEWNGNYTALYYALSFEHIVTPFGKLVYEAGDLLKVMTFVAYYTELVLPFLLLIPFFSAYFRIAFIVIICLFHIGISSMMYVGLFPLINLVSVIGLIPGLIQDRLNDRHDYIFDRAFGFLRKQSDRFRYITWRGLYRYSQSAGEEAAKLKAYIPKEKWLTSLVIAFFIVYTLCWNISNLRVPVPVLDKVRWIAHLVRVDQFWGMFAPAVFKDDGWFVLVGKTVKGKEVDIKNPDKPVSYAKPAVVAEFFPDDRWRKYHENILFVNNNHYRLYYCAYLTNQWNKKQTSKDNLIPNLKIIYMKQVSLPDYQEATPKKEILFDCNTELK